MQQIKRAIFLRCERSKVDVRSQRVFGLWAIGFSATAPDIDRASPVASDRGITHAECGVAKAVAVLLVQQQSAVVMVKRLAQGLGYRAAINYHACGLVGTRLGVARPATTLQVCNCRGQSAAVMVNAQC